MKREIKFRGLRTDGKGWVYGDLVRDKHLNGVDTLLFILTEEAKTFDDVIPVDTESVGQFTGLKDKNGVDIYDGDIMTYNQAVSFETKVENKCYGHGDYGKSITIGFVFHGYYGHPEDLEIISNIHES